MSSFTAARVTRSQDGRGGDRFDVEAFTFYVGRPDSGVVLHVPAQQRVGPSVPIPLLRLMPRPSRRWVIRCLLKASFVHDAMRHDLQFELEDCDAYFLIAMSADMPSWPGPGWARVALREIAFAAVRLNRRRD